MLLSQIITRLEKIKLSRGDLDIKSIETCTDFDDIALGWDNETDMYNLSTLRFINDLPY